MLVYLDSCIVIYAVEGQTPFRRRAEAALAHLEENGDRFAVSDLVRLECLLKPMGIADDPLLMDYEHFFQASSVRTVPMGASVYRRAASIRGRHRYQGGLSGKRYSLPDALHLAAAVEVGSAVFLTNDDRLQGFGEIRVESLA